MYFFFLFHFAHANIDHHINISQLSYNFRVRYLYLFTFWMISMMRFLKWWNSRILPWMSLKSLWKNIKKFFLMSGTKRMWFLWDKRWRLMEACLWGFYGGWIFELQWGPLMVIFYHGDAAEDKGEEVRGGAIH